MSNFDQYFSQLNPEEQAYFIACTDIFHDLPYNVIGRPSMSRQLQNTVTLNLERTITKTDFPGLPAGNWDVNMVSFPWITNVAFRTSVDFGSGIDNTVVVPANMFVGGISCFAAGTGLPTFSYLTTPNYITLAADSLLYPQGVTNNSLVTFYEILAMGFEVYNVTPELYVGGSLVRYRIPTQNRTALRQIRGPASNVTTPVYGIPAIPTTESLATQYPDSVVADAKDGTYQQHAIQDAVSDFRMTENISMEITPITIAPAAPTDSNCWLTTATDSYVQIAPAYRGDFDIVGSYFAGLPEQTVLKIRYRVIVSTVPNSTNSQLVSLAKTSPPDNPLLTQLISQVQHQFPAGIPVSMNPKGEWWKKIVRKVAETAPAIGEHFGGKTGREAGDLVRKGTNLLLTSSSNKKKKTNNKNPSQKPKNKPKAKPKSANGASS